MANLSLAVFPHVTITMCGGAEVADGGPRNASGLVSGTNVIGPAEIGWGSRPRGR